MNPVCTSLWWKELVASRWFGAASCRSCLLVQRVR